MPTTTTSEVPTRWGRLRRFMAVMARTWVRVRMTDPRALARALPRALDGRVCSQPFAVGHCSDWGGAASLLPQAPPPHGFDAWRLICAPYASPAVASRLVRPSLRGRRGRRRSPGGCLGGRGGGR